MPATNTIPALAALTTRDAAGSLETHDAWVVVVHSPVAEALAGLSLPASVMHAIEAARSIDEGLARGPRPPALLPAPGAPGSRVVLALMGTLVEDTDDVRLVSEATAAAVERAVAAGARRVVLSVATPHDARYARALDVATLAALGTAWVPLEAREAGVAPATLASLSVVGLDPAHRSYLTAMETGRALARDITGTEPERMAPERVAAFCLEAFAGTSVKVSVERDLTGYPLMAAVARASMQVERHRPCIVRLEYTPPGAIGRTLFIAAKGVTYDTGGADVKTDGHMAGMSRDKGGAGAAAGLLRTLAAADAPGVRVVALLGMVRNSVGEESFVSDEIIRARSGVRVRIGNTDAEGRLVLSDLLSALRDEAAGAPGPLLCSIATLTGHVHRAFGPYTGAIENGPARAGSIVTHLAAHADAWGEPLEWTRVRREDYAFVAARSSTEDCVSSNRLASVNTPRGHQGPFAFIDVASGLRGGTLPLVHLDIGGVAVAPADWQFGRPTGIPIATLASWVVHPIQ